MVLSAPDIVQNNDIRGRIIAAIRPGIERVAAAGETVTFDPDAMTGAKVLEETDASRLSIRIVDVIVRNIQPLGRTRYLIRAAKLNPVVMPIPNVHGESRDVARLEIIISDHAGLTDLHAVARARDVAVRNGVVHRVVDGLHGDFEEAALVVGHDDLTVI